MLVLKRGEGDVIVIGDDIRIFVTKIVGSRVYLGVDAPQDISVYRKEIWDRIQEQKAAAV